MLQIGATLFYYKLGQTLLQIGAAFIITNWGKCCYKVGQLLQIRATVITKWGSYYKLGQNLLQIDQVLQIRVIITNCGTTQVYKKNGFILYEYINIIQAYLYFSVSGK